MRIIVTASIILFCLMLIFIGGGNKSEYPKEVICKNNSCIDETINHFNNCVELGKERIGFMTYEKYHLCDGTKIVNKCLEKNNSYYTKDNNYTGDYILPWNCEAREINSLNTSIKNHKS